MVTILKPTMRKSQGERLSEGIGRGLETLEGMMRERQSAEEMKQENESLKKEFGIDLSGIKNTKIREKYIDNILGNQKFENEYNANSMKNLVEENRQHENKLKQLEHAQKLKSGEKEKEFDRRQKLIDQVRGTKKVPQQQNNGPSEEDIEEAIRQAEQIYGDFSPETREEFAQNLRSFNQTASGQNGQMGQYEQGMQEEDPFLESELYAAANEPILSRVSSEKAKAGIKKQENEINRQTQLTAEKGRETMPLRKEYADKAKYARQGIENKEAALKLLEKGKIDDPLVVHLAEKYLPGAIGNKILSPDTQLYKAGLFDEFGVLKNMFPGQIRVKEIELLEDKIATLDKSNPAKKKILETGVKKLKRDVILGKAAAKVEKEYPNLGVLGFDEKVQEIAQPELDKLFNEIIESYNDIYFEYAPSKSSYKGSNGVTYRDIPKAQLKRFFEDTKKDGIDIEVLK